KKDEVGVILSNEQNDFLIANAAQMEEIEELGTNICMMVRIQLANIDSDEGPSYDSAFISEVQTPSTSNMNPLFLDKVNSGIVVHDKKDHDSHDNELEQLARNAYKEAEKQQIIAQKVKQQNVVLTKQLEQYKERVRVFETNNATKTNFHKGFIKADRQAKQQRKQVLELQTAQTSLKRKINANEDTYLDDVLNLEAKLKKNENVVIKMSNYVQALFMLGLNPLSVYDPQLKHGLGYENPDTLNKAIS
ncbi:hypothetical protein Tco_1051105, partial [Tanacetum coccineum]